MKNSCFPAVSPTSAPASTLIALSHLLIDRQKDIRPYGMSDDFSLFSFGGFPAENFAESKKLYFSTLTACK